MILLLLTHDYPMNLPWWVSHDPPWSPFEIPIRFDSSVGHEELHRYWPQREFDYSLDAPRGDWKLWDLEIDDLEWWELVEV